jgi:hypothetical protein
MSTFHRTMLSITLGALTCISCGALEGGGSTDPREACTFATDLGRIDVREVGLNASVERRAFGGIRLSLPVGPDVTDRLTLELHPNQGTLGEIAPGTYVIAGPELEYATCGLCAYVETNLHPDEAGRFEIATDYYWARSGSLVVHNVRERFVAELRALELATTDGRCGSVIEELAIDVKLNGLP